MDVSKYLTVYKQNNAEQYRKYDHGDYARFEYSNGDEKEMFYIGGGDGLAAVYVKETGESNQLYFTVKDHLNSTWALINESGSVEELYAFDPCSRFFQTHKRSAVGLYKNRNPDEEQRNREGKRVSPTNWDVEDARTNLILDIGFTGHEHLDELGLINMKARMYDPILGQFISPDPYVLDEGLSINYNRYAYCLNNPLKYTDPTGMWWYQDEDGDWYEKNDPNTKDDDYDSQGRRRYDENGVLIPESERGDPVYYGSPDIPNTENPLSGIYDEVMTQSEVLGDFGYTFKDGAFSKSVASFRPYYEEFGGRTYAGGEKIVTTYSYDFRDNFADAYDLFGGNTYDPNMVERFIDGIYESELKNGRKVVALGSSYSAVAALGPGVSIEGGRFRHKGKTYGYFSIGPAVGAEVGATVNASVIITAFDDFVPNDFSGWSGGHSGSFYLTYSKEQGYLRTPSATSNTTNTKVITHTVGIGKGPRALSIGYTFRNSHTWVWEID